jgi:hypothetical protein
MEAEIFIPAKVGILNERKALFTRSFFVLCFSFEALNYGFVLVRVAFAIANWIVMVWVNINHITGHFGVFYATSFITCAEGR